MDEITVKILEDGSVVVVTDKISAGNHGNADAALRMLEGLLGGSVVTENSRRKTTRGHVRRHVRQ